jgi:hypothetical protein
VNKSALAFMSSLPERSEKRCLNCETLVFGRFCQVCGQENSNHRLGFWQMAKHFVFDIFHFDGKFWHTLKYLVARPGFVTAEYISGKRASYLEPVKMYVFTSAIFFLVFFTFFTGGIRKEKNNDHQQAQNQVLLKIPDSGAVIQKRDSGFRVYLPGGRKPVNIYGTDARIIKTDTGLVAVVSPPVSHNQKPGATVRVMNSDTLFRVPIANYRNFEEYDSMRRASPTAASMNLFKKIILKRIFYLQEKSRSDPGGLGRSISEDMLHQLPKALFVLLPLFAFILSILYKRKKRWLYMDHGIFSIHIFVVWFIAFFFMFLSGSLADIAGFSGLRFASGIIFIAIEVYLYKAMKNFYKQGTGKTLLKFLLLNLASAILVAIILIIFLIISLLQLK